MFSFFNWDFFPSFFFFPSFLYFFLPSFLFLPYLSLSWRRGGGTYTKVSQSYFFPSLFPLSELEWHELFIWVIETVTIPALSPFSITNLNQFSMLPFQMMVKGPGVCIVISSSKALLSALVPSFSGAFCPNTCAYPTSIILQISDITFTKPWLMNKYGLNSTSPCFHYLLNFSFSNHLPQFMLIFCVGVSQSGSPKSDAWAGSRLLFMT